MELFNEYYNSELQCLLNLFSLNRPFTTADIQREARVAHVYSMNGQYDDVLERWKKNSVIAGQDQEHYTVREGLFPFAAPLNALETEALAAIVCSPEAMCVLSEDLRRQLCAEEQSGYSFVNCVKTPGKRALLSPENAPKLCTIIQAIYEHKRIAYRYRTNASPEEREAEVVPYRLEHSAFDGRWWLISYTEAEKRTIKSKLENLRSIQILDKHNIEEEKIRQSILSHLAKEPVVLRICGESEGKVRNVLERCSIAFENMQDIGGRQIGETEFELQFRYFDWDESTIVRNVLMLGECVTVLSPKRIVDQVVDELKAAIAQCKAI